MREVKSRQIPESSYLELKKIPALPRLPLKGFIDLTYRCNNNCRHCWLNIPPDSPEQGNELSFEQIRKVVEDARRMGCRSWFISGGEPMLRPDFADIFEFITSVSNYYSFNTNGTLITPRIAQLLRRKGTKMVALYGATAEVHDHITRTPGSFEALMRGMAYLKEAGAGFIVQIVPMKDNHHHIGDMVKLAESLSPHYRIGAAWLYLSASGDDAVNAEIKRQRISAREVVDLDKPDPSYLYELVQERSSCAQKQGNDAVFSDCIAAKCGFHIDPYGQMTFCPFIKAPDLRYDLKTGSFQEAWSDFIPSLKDRIKITAQYGKSCGSCDYKKSCRFCPVYGYLEHRDFNKKVDYICAIAEETRRFELEWTASHRRYFRVADITFQVDSDLPFADTTFAPKFKKFEVSDPGDDTVCLRHHFSMPDLNSADLQHEVYRRTPWAVYRNDDSWIYQVISSASVDKQRKLIAVFSPDHTRASVYHENRKLFLNGNLSSFTLFPTDQLLVARILADRQGCYFHASGVNLKGRGLLFVGESGAGKTTMARMLTGKAEILCDDRVIVRRKEGRFKAYGTWSHGEVPEVSASSAPLEAIMFLRKAKWNRLIRVEDKNTIARSLLSNIIKPLVTSDWWHKSLTLLEAISNEVPCYVLEFDKSGEVIKVLEEMDHG